MRGAQNSQSLMLSTLFLIEGALHYERDTKFSELFLVEGAPWGALYYERDTKFQEPNALNTLYSSPSDQIPAMTSSFVF